MRVKSVYNVNTETKNSFQCRMGFWIRKKKNVDKNKHEDPIDISGHDTVLDEKWFTPQSVELTH